MGCACNGDSQVGAVNGDKYLVTFSDGRTLQVTGETQARIEVTASPGASYRKA